MDVFQNTHEPWTPLNIFGSHVGRLSILSLHYGCEPIFYLEFSAGRSYAIFNSVLFFFFPQHGSLTRSCHYQLFNISKIRSSFTAVAAQALGQSLWASSHWGYWYKLMVRLPVTSFSSIQWVRNSARLNFLLSFGQASHLSKELQSPHLSQRIGVWLSGGYSMLCI